MDNIKHRSNFEYKDYPSELTVKEDGGWIKVIYIKKADDWRSLDPAVIRMNFENNRFTEIAIVIQYDKNGDFFFGEYNKPLVKGNGKIFPKKQWLGVIKTENGKVRTGHTNDFDRKFIQCFLTFFGVECITNYTNLNTIDNLIRYAILRKPVLKGIITGKITNRKALIKTLMTTSYHIKDFRYETIEKYFNSNINQSLSTLAKYTTDLNESVRLLALSDSTSYFDRNLFCDLIQDAFILDKKINPRWSVRRMQEEHQKNIETETLLKEGSLSDEPIYECIPVIDERGIKGNILNSEKEVYQEASFQHNCLHTHYWSKIKNRNYIAISLSVPERITVGLTVKGNDDDRSLSIEQMHTRYNAGVRDEHKDIIVDYIRRHQEQLTSLVEAKDYNDTYMVIRMPRNAKSIRIQTYIRKFNDLIKKVKQSISIIKGESYALPFVQPYQNEDYPF